MRRPISRKSFISKKAQEEKDEQEQAENDSGGGTLREHLANVLATLRAQYVSYQTSHWLAMGVAFYSEHLMFERLYNSVLEEIDTLAEKLVCFEGDASVDMVEQTEKIHLLCKKWAETSCPIERGLESEKFVQSVLEEAYEAITKSDEMTLGLDDFLMATANAHEENMYLLKRNLKK